MNDAGCGLSPDDELIDVAHVPDGARLRLVRNGGDFVILLDHDELMSTDLHASEQALATMTFDRLGPRPGLRTLIGGYGMGFTLRAALAVLDADADVTLAEVVPEVLDWARGPMHRVTAGCLDDPRVCVVSDDVAMLIDAADGAYDAILLDVDNGAHAVTRRVNDWLYSPSGLAAAMTALRRRGILAVWSAFPDAAFADMLSRAGFAVAVAPVEARVGARPVGDGRDHVIFFAQRD